MHFIVQREKNTVPEPVSPQMGGSSPKCGPHRKSRTPSPAWQKPTWPLARSTPQHRGHSWQVDKVFKVIKVVKVFKVVKVVRVVKVIEGRRDTKDFNDLNDLNDLKPVLGLL